METQVIQARGKRITQAVDVSQMIAKRMDAVGYVISDVRIASELLTSQDGKERKVSNMEIDISKEQFNKFRFNYFYNFYCYAYLFYFIYIFLWCRTSIYFELNVNL